MDPRDESPLTLYFMDYLYFTLCVCPLPPPLPAVSGVRIRPAAAPRPAPRQGLRPPLDPGFGTPSGTHVSVSYATIYATWCSPRGRQTRL
jgi:hypothetical protein